jgi:hypothetical protein
MTLYSEVVDSPENARKFLEMNNITQDEIRAIVVVWEEE